MRVLLPLGFLAVLAFSVVGCATDDPEADAFFQRGWLNPKELDGPEMPPMDRGIQGPAKPPAN